MTPVLHSALRLPEQELESHSLFACENSAVSQWVDDLPLGSPHRAGASLRTAISELNRVTLPPLLRFQLLELLRVPLHSVVTALTRSCLNQPIVLDDDAQQQADLITDLCALIATGYTLTGVHTIHDNHTVADINPAKLACESLHRAVVYSGQRILTAFLLYQPVAMTCWAGLHQLYALAERQQLARLPIDDALREIRSTIAQEYMPPLLLACAKPNQLRQLDISGAYRAFLEWRDLAELQDPEFGSGLFAVDMQSDKPPAFAELLVRRGTAQFRYINTSGLITYLEELKRSRGSQGLRVIEFDRETRLDTNLLEHLIKSLGEISQRNFARRQARTELHIASGLTNVHYFVAGERSLEEVFHGDSYQPSAEEKANANPFLRASSGSDKWQQANPEEDFDEHESDEETSQAIEVDRITRLAMEQDKAASTPVRHLVYSVKTTNTSPGGYCVEWNDPPEGIQIGDLVCVREAELEHSDWTIAVVRWISQVKNAPTLLGLELISPRGTAYAAQIKMPDGELSKPIRVLVLPEIPLVGQAHTMVVPRLVFKEGQRITLTREEDAFLVKLKRQVSSTGYFSQLDFDYLRQLDDDTDKGRGEKLPATAFDSIWSDI